MADFFQWALGPDWQAWLVYIGGALVLCVGLGYGLWKGNG